MRSKLIFTAIAAFWAVMMFLLARAEFGFGGGISGSIAPEAVWEKILTAQDTSSLEVHFRGKRVGMCRWASAVIQDDALQGETEASLAAEGRVKRATGYTAELDGTLAISALTNTLRFSLAGSFATNLSLGTWEVRLTLKPLEFSFATTTNSGGIEMGFSDGLRTTRRNFTREQLSSPDALLREIAGPAAFLVAGQMKSALTTAGISTNAAAAGIRWAAGFDWMNLGHGSLRVYVLRGTLGENLRATIWVSRAGEILRVELPNGIVVVNSELPRLKPRSA